MSEKTIELFGKPFRVDWHRDDNRLIANCDNGTCYEIVSFQSTANDDSEMLENAFPLRIEKCWLVNPDYQPTQQRRRIGSRAWTAEGDWLPPEARDLAIITIKNCKPPSRYCIRGKYGTYLDHADQLAISQLDTMETRASKRVLRILKEVFRPCGYAGFLPVLCPGEPAVMASFQNGETHFLKSVRKCQMPTEAKMYFQAVAQTELLSKTKRDSETPDYFGSLEAAAKYAGVTPRTIQNWKRRGWLVVEQIGRKIRIARAELDKCKKRT